MDTTERKNVTASLYPDKDADLIRWFDALPKTAKVSDEIKTMLRRGLGLPVQSELNKPPSIDSAELDAIKRAVASVPNTMRQYADDLADQFTADMERQREQYAAEIQELQRRLNELSIRGVLPTSETIEPAPRVDQEALAERKAKMKKAAW